MNDLAPNEKVLAADKQDQDFSNTTHPKNSKPAAENQCDLEAQTASLQLDLSDLGKVKRQFPEELEAWPNTVDMDVLADEIANLITKHSVLPAGSVDAMVLWTVSSYMINAFRIFPKLAFISPEKRCGKTTTLEIMQSLCRNGVQTSNISPASIYRLTSDGLQPTVLIDEADTTIQEGSSELRGLINSGHNKSGSTVIRCQGDDHKSRTFYTWYPMILASIGDLPSTIMDRSIVVNIRRKKPSEMVQQLPKDSLECHQHFRRKILTWAAQHAKIVKSSTCVPPDVGNDRAMDNWLPLFQIAKAISERWLDRCDKAYRALTDVVPMELPTQLLMDIRDVMDTAQVESIKTHDLIKELCADDSKPWINYSYGKPIKPNELSSILKTYSISPKVMRYGDKTHRGYNLEMFSDAFERYLPSPSRNTVTSQGNQGVQE